MDECPKVDFADLPTCFFGQVKEPDFLPTMQDLCTRMGVHPFIDIVCDHKHRDHDIDAVIPNWRKLGLFFEHFCDPANRGHWDIHMRSYIISTRSKLPMSREEWQNILLKSKDDRSRAGAVEQ